MALIIFSRLFVILCLGECINYYVGSIVFICLLWLGFYRKVNLSSSNAREKERKELYVRSPFHLGQWDIIRVYDEKSDLLGFSQVVFPSQIRKWLKKMFKIPKVH